MLCVDSPIAFPSVRSLIWFGPATAALHIQPSLALSSSIPPLLVSSFLLSLVNVHLAI